MVPATYARLTRFALWALALIVVTGTAVRLTGSGLGCSDWPTCSQDQWVSDLEYHALVEFMNRLFTGVVAASVIAAVGGAWRRLPRRRDLIWLSSGLVAGVLGQVVLGALLVRTELDPRFTMGHFLLSMVLLWNASVLDSRARYDSSLNKPDALSRIMLGAVLVTGAALLVTGTLVTGAGPHAGDSRAERLPLLVREVARTHSIVAICLLLLVVSTWLRLRAAGVANHRRMARVAVLLVVQGAVGYTQYFMGVPVLLVGIHVALASITWIEIAKSVHTPHMAQSPATTPDAADTKVLAPVQA